MNTIKTFSLPIDTVKKLSKFCEENGFFQSEIVDAGILNQIEKISRIIKKEQQKTETNKNEQQ